MAVLTTCWRDAGPGADTCVSQRLLVNPRLSSPPPLNHKGASQRVWRSGCWPQKSCTSWDHLPWGLGSEIMESSLFPTKDASGFATQRCCYCFFLSPSLGCGDQGLKRNKIRPTSEREQTTPNQTDREPFSKGYSLCWALCEHLLNLMRKELCDFIPSGLLFSRTNTFSFSTWEFCFIGCLDKYKVTSYLSNNTMTNIKWKSLHSLWYVRSLALDFF